jgi:hypothetical protein
VLFNSDNWWTTVASNVEFGLQVNHKHAQEHYMKHFYALNIKNMVMMWIFEVVCNNFHTRENYVQK